MTRKQFATVCVLLIVIIVLLIIIISKIDQFHTDFVNTSNFLAQLLDGLAIKMNALKS